MRKLMAKIRLKLNDVSAAEREMKLILGKDKVEFVTTDGNIKIDISQIVTEYNVFQAVGEPTRIELSILNDEKLAHLLDIKSLINLNKQIEKIINERNYNRL